MPANGLQRVIDHLPMRETWQILLATFVVDAATQERIGACDLELV
jgi:hypothetical protein